LRYSITADGTYSNHCALKSVCSSPGYIKVKPAEVIKLFLYCVKYLKNILIFIDFAQSFVKMEAAGLSETLVTTYPNTSVNNLEQPTTAESKPLK
jgi:hypothetical protein